MISVAPVWRPGTQLTTLLTIPQDIRYVDAEIYVTTSVEYWAVEFTCTVAPTVLQDYVQDTTNATPNDPGDDVPMIRWAPAWGMSSGVTGTGLSYTSVQRPFSRTTGSMLFSASRLGNWSPMGTNGYTQSTLVVTVRYQVKTIAGLSGFSCASTFLDRNGVPVLAASFVPPPALSIIAGYTIGGTVSYQSRAAKNGIGVQCQLLNSSTLYNTVTDIYGHFTITTRALGDYICFSFGNISNPAPGWQEDVYLLGVNQVPLHDQSYALLPVVLRGGNVDRSAGPTEGTIDGLDLAMITSNYNGLTPNGDVNGDGYVTKADLAIAAGNFGYSDYIDASHVLYGVARDYGTTASNNRIWLGGVDAGPVTQFVATTSRDFWPALSPNGSKIAFTRLVGNKQVLFVAPVGGAPVQITPTTGTNSWVEAFAPSWSPDGSKIAFICSSNGLGWYNRGSLCTIDPTGKNFQGVADDNTVKIYPPAWLDNHVVLFATNSNNVNCPNTICKVDTSELYPTPVAFDASIPGGSDMPVVRRGLSGNTLLYRTPNGGGHSIVFAEFSGSGPLSPFGTVGHDYAKANGQPLATNVDYFAVRANDLSLMYTDASAYVFNLAWATYPPTTPPTWQQPYTIWVYDMFGNPYWSGNPNDPTYLWAGRNTVDWEP